MPMMDTQDALRKCAKLSFCYLCGKEFTPSEKPNRDHVPPRSIFATNDRCDPLILPTHEDCNGDESVGDEIVGQLVAVLHGKHPKKHRGRLKFGLTTLPGSKQDATFIYGHDLRPCIWRYVKGFHAALYKEHLEVNGKANVHLPFPEGHRQGNTVKYLPILDQQYTIADELRKSRIAKTIDRISCYQEKCIYECIWVKMNTGEWHCLFCLRLYNWENLGDIHNFPKQGCVGAYCSTKGRPASGTTGTLIDFPCPTEHPLDPFA